MLKIVELFAGVGSQKKALRNLGLKHEVLNIAEWFIPAILAYDSIHNGERDLSEIQNLSLEEIRSTLSRFTFSMNSKKPMTKQAFNRLNENVIRNLFIANKRTKNLVSIDKVKGNELPSEIDVLTYSFPCQDLSNVGAFHGYTNGIDRDKKSRSGLLWEVERLLQERSASNLCLPKVLLMENVSALLSPRHSNNFNSWISSLNELGYISKYYTLNSRDFGIPQNRCRIFMISVLTRDLANDEIDDVKMLLKKEFEKKNEYRKLKEFLRVDYKGKYKKEADDAQPNDTKSRRMIYQKNYYLYGEDKDRLKADFCPTITTRQDRHPNSGVIDYKGPRNMYRFLSAREVFLLMGFTEEDYERVENSNFYRNSSSKFYSRDKYYILAGNSIVVDVLEAIFLRINKILEIT